jgi:hypothetical protein
MPRDADGPGFTLEAALPELVVQGANLPATAYELRDHLAASGRLYDRGGVPVLLRWPADGGLPYAQTLTANAVVTLAHALCRPVKMNAEGHRIGVTLPERVARLYLDLDCWGLRPLNGITSAPLLADDGGIIAADGYDSRLGIWCAHVPSLAVPATPSQAEAAGALVLLRETFRTFPFADSPFVERDGLTVVDTSKPAMLAEAGFLCGLLTAVCRPSLHLAPGLCITAPDVTGSGAGKGLLVRATCAIAYGIKPSPFTAGHNREELDKRLVSELIEAGPVTFLDNVNGAVLRSDTLACVLTERPARVRPMCTSKTVPLNCASLIALTGNGLSVSEDLARRFLAIELAPQCEDAETRPFPGGFLASIFDQRAELLTAVLTIWRWGRQAKPKAGLVLASYEDWGRWCRDPLIELGCRDPVERVRQAKQADPRRRIMAELFACWHQHHKTEAVTAADLAQPVVEILDPLNRGRQYRASRLRSMVGTRAAGFVLTFAPSTGKWGAGAYALAPTGTPNGDQTGGPKPSPPMPPMIPMVSQSETQVVWRGEL